MLNSLMIKIAQFNSKRFVVARETCRGGFSRSFPHVQGSQCQPALRWTHFWQRLRPSVIIINNSFFKKLKKAIAQK